MADSKAAAKSPRSIRAVHHIRGRIRLRIPGSKGDFRMLEEIQRAITCLDGVKSVEANGSTGSLLVHYDPAMHERFHEQLTEHGGSVGAFSLKAPELSEIDELAKSIEKEADFLSQHSETARKIVDGFRRLDRATRIATGNAVDLKVLLPLGLAAYSLVEIGLEASTPLWVTLGIFSFNSFLTLHAPDPKANTRTSLVISEHPAEPAPKATAKTARKRKARQT